MYIVVSTCLLVCRCVYVCVSACLLVCMPISFQSVFVSTRISVFACVPKLSVRVTLYMAVKLTLTRLSWRLTIGEIDNFAAKTADF